ncbi:MAG: excinuclease ABC subunit UvrC [Angelakisella sp.]
MNEEKLAELRQKTLTLPQEPGVYRMRGKAGEIIYIGKAKSLKNRVSSYFRSVDKHQLKVYRMVENVWDFDYIVTDSEFEALVLECSLIKLHRPKYNILLKDDKGYSYIKISKGDYGRITAEKVKNEGDGVYLGPYMSGLVVKETVDEAVKAFRLPCCSRRFPEDLRKGRPCLNYHIKQCMGVCTGRVSREAYSEALSEAIDFIKNGGAQSVPILTAKMEAAAETLDFEKAARYRDRINAINRITDQQKVIAYNHKSLDVVAAVQAEDTVYLAVLIFRDGRLRDKRSYTLDFFESMDTVLEGFLLSYYDGGDDLPSELFIDRDFPDRGLTAQLLSQSNGKKLTITVPQRGQSLQLVEMARNNAAQELSQKTNRTGKELAAADQLGRLLGLAATPMYIEAYDISNIGGQTIVGGMVVFEKGRPQRKYYKRFTIRDLQQPDDYAAMDQMLMRRFGRYLDENDKDKGFKTLPDLMLIDGGANHVSVAKSVLERLGLSIPVFGMVKDSHHRTRAISAGNEEIAINANRSVFSLVTSIQDEVHRYSIEYSRSSHRKNGMTTRLLSIEGIGEGRAAALFRHFKTYKAMLEATPAELRAVKGMTAKAAENLYAFLHENDNSKDATRD